MFTIVCSYSILSSDSIHAVLYKSYYIKPFPIIPFVDWDYLTDYIWIMLQYILFQECNPVDAFSAHLIKQYFILFSLHYHHWHKMRIVLFLSIFVVLLILTKEISCLWIRNTLTRQFKIFIKIYANIVG
jgi:hypothetical protein